MSVHVSAVNAPLGKISDLLSAKPDYVPANFWVEKAMVIGFPLRSQLGFEVGSALASPQRSISGSDLYKTMRQVRPGDVILHFTDSVAITGISVARSAFEELRLGREMWYRVPLRSYKRLIPPLHRDVMFGEPFGVKLLSILREQTNQNLFYERRLRLRQGGYLTPINKRVFSILDEAYASISPVTLSDLADAFASP